MLHTELKLSRKERKHRLLQSPTNSEQAIKNYGNRLAREYRGQEKTVKRENQ